MNKQFTSALIATLGSAEWIEWPISVDGNQMTTYLESKSWSEASYL